MKTPTLRQIAAACEVSVSTVSRALAGHASIPAPTRRRVRRAAVEMGWKPNPLAAAYMAHLRSTSPASYKAQLAFVIDYPIPKRLEELPGHVFRTFQGAAARAATYGYHLIPFSPHESDMTMAKLDRTLFNRNIPGVIFYGFRKPGAVVRDFTWSRYASTTTGYTLVEPALDRITANVARAFDLILNKAFEMGYRHLAVAVSREYDQQTGHGVLYPVHYAEKNLAPGRRIDTLILPAQTPEQVPAVRDWLARCRPELAVGIYVHRAIQELGWRVPQDIAFMSVERHPEFADQAGVDQRHDLIGQLAADLVIAKVTHNQRGIPEHPVHHLVAGTWHDGPSAPPIHHARASDAGA